MSSFKSFNLLAEFAFEIGSGLLTEVRRLQSLLGERDKAITELKYEQDALTLEIESLKSALREAVESSGTILHFLLNICMNFITIRQVQGGELESRSEAA